MASGEKNELEKGKESGRLRRRSGDGPTVADVARLAQVSQMTVSRVTNRAPNVLPETQRKVEAAIAKLGYVPNLAARNLAGGKLVRIAMLYSNPSAAYLSEFLVGCLDEASRLGVQLVLEKRIEGEGAKSLVRRLVDARTDAVLLPPPLCDDADLIAALSNTQLQFAQVATGRPDARAHAVSIDDEKAAYEMTMRLVRQGHRRIGFIAGNTNQSASAERLAGYRRALRERERPVDDELIASGRFSYRSGWDAAEELLAQTERPTAIFASNDDMAAATIAVAHRRRISVPHQLSVCGFDDTAIATTVWPELTTIRQPIADMSRRALALLTSSVMAEDDSAPQHELIDFKLVERESDAIERDMDNRTN